MLASWSLLQTKIVITPSEPRRSFPAERAGTVLLLLVTVPVRFLLHQKALPGMYFEHIKCFVGLADESTYHSLACQDSESP